MDLVVKFSGRKMTVQLMVKSKRPQGTLKTNLSFENESHGLGKIFYIIFKLKLKMGHVSIYLYGNKNNVFWKTMLDDSKVVLL